MNGMRRPGQGNGWPVKGQGRRILQTTAARSIPMPPRDPAPPCNHFHPETSMSLALEAAIASAQKATLELHGLMAIHGISFKELDLLLEWPAGLREAHATWTARMADVIRRLAREKGVPDASKMSERDLTALTVRAFDLVMS